MPRRQHCACVRQLTLEHAVASIRALSLWQTHVCDTSATFTHTIRMQCVYSCVHADQCSDSTSAVTLIKQHSCTVVGTVTWTDHTVTAAQQYRCRCPYRQNTDDTSACTQRNTWNLFQSRCSHHVSPLTHTTAHTAATLAHTHHRIHMHFSRLHATIYAHDQAGCISTALFGKSNCCAE